MACEFISNKSLFTRNSKSSSLFQTNINNKKQKYMKNINLLMQKVLTQKSMKETKYY